MQDRDAPSDLSDKFMLRLPTGMRDAIAAEAKRNGRSMNSEVVALLSERFGDAMAAERERRRVERILEEQRDLLSEILAVLKGQASAAQPSKGS